LADCVQKQALFGLVLEKLVAYNPLLEAATVAATLTRCGVVWSTWPLALATDDHPAQVDTAMAKPRVSMAQLFEPKHDALILSRLFEAGIHYLDEVTDDKLKQVAKSTGIGAGKLARIQQRLEVAEAVPLIANGQLQEQAITVALRGERDRPIKEALLAQGLESMQDVYPQHILALPKDVWAKNGADRLIRQYSAQMGKMVPEQSVATALMPLAEQLYPLYFSAVIPTTLPLKQYLFMISGIAGLKPRPQNKLGFYQPIQAHLVELVQAAIREGQSPSTVVTSQVQFMAKVASVSVANIAPEVLQYSWWVYQQLLPEPFDALMDAYRSQLSEEYQLIMRERLQQDPATTLEVVGKQIGKTRERIRQVQQKVSDEFSQWWQNLRLSFKLPLTLEQQSLRVVELFKGDNAQLIAHTIAATAQPLAQYLLSAQTVTVTGEAALQPLTKDSLWLQQVQIDQQLARQHVHLNANELRQVMTQLNFKPSAQPALWVKQSGVTRSDLIRLYMKAHDCDRINTNKAGYTAITDWTKQTFGRSLTPSLRSFLAAVAEMPDMIPVQKGQYRRLDLANYDRALFAEGKKLVQAHFAAGHRSVRDKWLVAQLQAKMSGDEFYQVFKTLYPDDFQYSTGRENDIYPLDAEKLTLGEQMLQVVRQYPDGISLGQLWHGFGWEGYTVQQTVATTPGLVIEEDTVSWINVVSAKQSLQSPLLDALQQAFAQAPIVPVCQIYAVYNEISLAHPEVLDETRIYTQAALVSFLKALPLALDVVGGKLLVQTGALPAIKRTSEAVWAAYLAQVAATPQTEAQLKVAALTAGMGTSTWDQVHLHLFEQAQILPVSQDRYLATAVIQQTPAINTAVGHVLQRRLQDQSFLAIQALTPAELADLPTLSQVAMAWTPELFASYAACLGYRRLQWPRTMLHQNYDALVPASSPYQTLPALMATLVDEWRQVDDNEIKLYQQAVRVKLMPFREDINKQRLPPLFYDAQGFMVDELRHVRRN
jgi:hypothetical protein